MAKLITGMFYDPASAELAVDDLEDLGYARSEISVITNDTKQVPRGTKEHHIAADAGIGAVYGGALGAILAGATATGTVIATAGAAAPIVVGPLAAVLAGLGAGAVAGGILGGLVGLGVPEDKAKKYEEDLKNGGILICVTPRAGSEAAVHAILEDGDIDAPTYHGSVVQEDELVETPRQRM